MTLNEMDIRQQQSSTFGQEDLAELGAALAAEGWTQMQARALIGLIQQVGTQTALNMAPQILEQVRQINTARLTNIHTQIRMLPTMAGYVSRDRVLQIIQGITNTPPRTS
jgi:hypothetical protein